MNNLLVIKASAGSGKTYNLALQYIRHLLFTTTVEGRMVPRRHEGDDRILNAHRQLLAITFTNKATDEMKQRIVDELYNLSRPGVESKYLQDFVAETGLTEERIRTLAQQALTELLFDYSNFNVFLSLNYLSLANNCFGCISLFSQKTFLCFALRSPFKMTKS